MSERLRIGEVAQAAGTTVRTIRYYEEIGLLPVRGDRASGSHRLYGEDDVERLRHLLRLKDLLGVSLDELRELVAAEDARPVLREEFRATDTPPSRRSAILRRALADIQRQQELVDRRRAQLDALDAELSARRERVLAHLDAPAAAGARG